MENSLNLLVSKLTGLKSNDSTYVKLFNKAKYTLKYAKCTSTSEKEVNDSFNGLADKFIIKGRRELSNALLSNKLEFLKTSVNIGLLDSNQRILKYDMLKLLLCLSSSLPNGNYIPERINSPEEPQVTWEDIIRDEPLAGDHWKSWPKDEDSIEEFSDEDLFEIDQATPEPIGNDTTLDELEADCFDRMEVDDRGEPEILEHLATQQYWRSDFSITEEYSSGHSLLQSPCSLNGALSEAMHHELPRRIVKEADVIREIMFLLKGQSGIMFHYSDYRQVFLLNKKYMVQHLSQGALASLLGEFCDFGTILSKLRGMASRILSDDSRYGQTAQAFATAVYKSLLSFEGQLSTLERDTRFITKDPSKTISVLKLRNALRTQLQCFQEIHSISKCIPFEDSSPKLIAYHLLSTLYERALTSQLSGQNTLYNAILYTFQQTVVPFGRLMDDWMFRGSLEGDKLKEFYVTRNDEISMDDPNFWTKGFSIQLTSQDTALIYCPLFEKRNVERIYFTGKAINLLLKIKKIQNEQVDFDQKPTLFSTIVGNAFPMQQPFIDTTDNTVGNDPEEAYDIFTQSLLSMVNTSKKPAPQDVSRSISSHDVLLFDQNFIQCIERYIQKPYMNTANRLNTALHNNCGLSAQLRLLASVYLMLENDMMHSFCEMIFAQIDNKENWFEKRSLNGTFVEACESNGYDESVCIDMESIHPRNQPTKGISETMASVLQFISFKISIPWPLNNFIQEDILIQYSKIAKFLLRLKRAKHVLEKKISFKGRVKYGKNDADYTWLYSVRMKMLWFVNTFWRYIMVTVLHVETINFHRSLSNSTNVDEITIFHVAYVSRIVEKCMLDEKSAIINMSILKMLGMAENLAGVFLKYIDTEEQIIKRSYQEHSPEDFVFDMSSIEKEFNLTNEFVLNGLLTLSKKSGLMWCETLAASLNAQQPTNN